MSRPVGRASGVSPMPVSEPAAGFRGLRRSIKKCLPRFMGRRRVFSRGGRLPPRSFSLSLIPCLAGKGAVVRLLPVLYFPGSWERHKKKGGRQKTCLPGLFFVRRFIRPWPWGLLPADLPERFSYVSRGACHSFSFCVRG